MAEIETPPIVGDLKERVEELTGNVGNNAQGGRRWLYILLIIGGLFVALVLLVKRSAKPVTAAVAADPVTAISGVPIYDQTTTSTPHPNPTPVPAPAPTPNPAPGPPPVKPPVTVTTTNPPPVPPPTPTTKTYTVKAGDTLGDIAAKNGTTALALYAKNKGTIDAWAKLHGHPEPYYNWIFPGEMLNI